MSKELTEERLRHLKFDRMKLNVSVPLVKNEEQRQHMEMKKQLLDERIAD